MVDQGKPKSRPPYTAPAGSQWTINDKGNMVLEQVVGSQLTGRITPSTGERAANRQDQSRDPYSPDPYQGRLSLARQDSLTLKQIAPGKQGSLGSAKERAQNRLTRANDPNIPDELKPYLPGTQPARTDTLIIEEPLARQFTETKRKNKANRAKEARQQRNSDRIYITGLRKEVRNIRNQMAKTEKNTERDIVRVNPPGSEGYIELREQLDDVKASIKEFNEQKKGGKLRRGKTSETAVDFDGTDAAFKLIPYEDWYFPPDGGPAEQKVIK